MLTEQNHDTPEPPVVTKLKNGMSELPVLAGGGVMGIAVIGLILSVAGLPFTILAEGAAAAVGAVSVAVARHRA